MWCQLRKAIRNDVVPANSTEKLIRAFRTPPVIRNYPANHNNIFSAVGFSVYDSAQKSYYFVVKYFFPEGALEGHPNERLYRIWAEQGWLTLTPGDVIDYKVIVNCVLDANKYLQILSIGFDPWKSQEVVNMLAAAGAKNVL